MKVCLVTIFFFKFCNFKAIIVRLQNITWKLVYCTTCPRGLAPLYIVSCYVKRAKTSWTYSKHGVKSNVNSITSICKFSCSITNFSESQKSLTYIFIIYKHAIFYLIMLLKHASVFFYI